jgi:hypothetical protein
MRYLITDLDSAGRSYVAEERVVSEPFDSTLLYRNDGSTPALPTAGLTTRLDLGVGVGALRWSIFSFEPGRFFEPHQTDTVDMDIVMGGAIELILDTGAHTLRVGDGAVINGVSHGWRVGAEGCVLSVTMLGGRRPM